MNRALLRHSISPPSALRASVVLVLLVLGHFTLMHGVDPSVAPMPIPAEGPVALVVSHAAERLTTVEHALRGAIDVCPLTSVRLEREPLPPLLALPASAATLLLGCFLVRSAQRIAPLPLPRGPARQALLQRFTL